ncbi:hypothetical protein ACOMHN_033369 [Nucella lapillus]
MAMSYHMEARIKQDRLNRWNEQKLRADAGPSNQGVDDSRLNEMAYKEKMDKVLTTDPGQFNQISTGHVVYSKQHNVLNLPADNVYALLHPPVPKYKGSRSHHQMRKQHFKLSVHAWTGTERNRRFYDYSCDGPRNGSSWRELRRELNFRESCLPTAMYENLGRVVPADPCFMSK